MLNVENSRLVHNSSVFAASISFLVISLWSPCIIKNKSECLKVRVYSTKKLKKMKFQVGNIQLSLSFNFLVINLLLFLCFISFCLKGEGLDGSYPAVIDYTPYLKFTQRYFLALLCFLKFYFIGKILFFIRPLIFHFICKMIFISQYKPVHSATSDCWDCYMIHEMWVMLIVFPWFRITVQWKMSAASPLMITRPNCLFS